MRTALDRIDGHSIDYKNYKAVFLARLGNVLVIDSKANYIQTLDFYLQP